MYVHKWVLTNSFLYLQFERASCTIMASTTKVNYLQCAILWTGDARPYIRGMKRILPWATTPTTSTSLLSPQTTDNQDKNLTSEYFYYFNRLIWFFTPYRGCQHFACKIKYWKDARNFKRTDKNTSLWLQLFMYNFFVKIDQFTWQNFYVNYNFF